MTIATIQEDAFYSAFHEHPLIITIALTHEWRNCTEMLVLVKNYIRPAGEDVLVDVVLAEVAP